MTNGIKPKGRMLSEVVEAAIKNIELYMKETEDFCESDQHLLTVFAIPQLNEVIRRLKQ